MSENARTTVVLPEVLLMHIQDNIKAKGITMKDFIKCSVINQLEHDGDFSIRDIMEERHGCEEA